MQDTVIKAEGLGKLYRLGEVGTGTISHDLHRWWAKLRGKEDPFLKVGELNDRTKKGESDYVWALNDINFEIRRGEAVGIIGRNGAGKSTLLKILSKITKPTSGDIKIKGRIAALLEVGTGFHPELTGRENIYLNGAILGMNRREIRMKFDSIVDFSGISKYIDTPVKRYSSGMYVRLAFAVAAFLDPDILIVDEVLAVGDLEFQKQCLGRMKDISEGEGRTVLFVSHNLNSIKQLCEKSILLGNGRVVAEGGSSQVINTYLNKLIDLSGEFEINQQNDRPLLIRKAILYNQDNKQTGTFRFGDNIKVELHIWAKAAMRNPNIWIELQQEDMPVTGATNMLDGFRPEQFEEGLNVISCTLFNVPLMPDKIYTIHVGIRDSGGITPVAASEDVAFFKVEDELSRIGFDPVLADSIGKEFTHPLIAYKWEHNSVLLGEYNTSNYVK